MFDATKNWWLEWNKIIKDINDNWMLIKLEYIEEHKLNGLLILIAELLVMI